MTDKFILDGHTPVPARDLLSWGCWFETANRHVAKDMVGDVKVSTVFLGLDHSFGEGPPLLFESMVFGGEMDGHMDRYATWEQAEKGHAELLERVRSRVGKDGGQ